MSFSLSLTFIFDFLDTYFRKAVKWNDICVSKWPCYWTNVHD